MSEQPRRRGRPRAYDPDTALRAATETFWDGGYAATSLDDLSAATGMNRPSLYAAFGDKEALYLRSLEAQGQRSVAALVHVLARPQPLRQALHDVYHGALSLYLGGAHGARGCYLVGTAATEAVLNPRVRAVLSSAFAAFDQAFEQRLRAARAAGELPAHADPVALSRVAGGLLHTLALRARAGERRAVLEGLIAAPLDLICPPAPAPAAATPAPASRSRGRRGGAPRRA